VDISGTVRSSYTPQLVMEGIIDDFETLRPALAKLAETAPALPLSLVRLRAPLPRPHKILCALANYWEHAQRAPRPLNMVTKNPDAVIGPRSEEHTSELQSLTNLVCRLLLEKKNSTHKRTNLCT